MLPIPFQQRAGAFVAGVAAAGAAYAGAQVCVQGVREERWRSRQKRKKKPSLLPPPTSSLPLSLFTPTAHALGVHPGPVVPPAQPAAPAHGCCLGESGDEGAEARARSPKPLNCPSLSHRPSLFFFLSPGGPRHRRRPALRAGRPRRRPPHLERRRGRRLPAGHPGPGEEGVVEGREGGKAGGQGRASGEVGRGGLVL